MHRKWFLKLTCLLILVSAVVLWRAPEFVSAQKAIDFNREVRPILSDNCFQCHGPDEKRQMAKLRLDTKAGAFAKTGVIVPGNAQQSRLFQRITASDPSVVMPPPESGHRLSAQQIETIKQWINQGATWTEHWAFVPPRAVNPPTVKNNSWVKNAIDQFILARLEKEGLQPSPAADRVTLIRRLSLDLTGLPPTLAEVDAFVADQDANAYEKVVDRFLASPHYGERFGMYWLDVARYADTHGYHIDSHRDMWPWRDWVINAFNQNKPYDKFIIEQLAGDLLPNATTEQKIGSGFNRNHMINFEGGAIAEEYLTEYVIDRVETTSNAFMALTMGCARCHSHKYDPISQKEFYQFYAFFNSVPEIGLDGRDGNAKPFLSLPTAEQKTKQAEISTAIKAKEQMLADPAVTAAQSQWEQQWIGKIPENPNTGLLAHYELEGNFTDSSGNFKHGRRIQGSPDAGGGKLGRAFYFDGDTQTKFGAVGLQDKNAPFSFSMWLRGNVNIPNTLLTKLENPQTRQGLEIFLDDYQLIGVQRRAPHINIRLAAKWPEDAIMVRSKDLIRIVDWGHVTITYDGSGTAAGIKLFFNGKPQELIIINDTLRGSFANQAELELGNKAFGKPYKGQLDDLRIYNRLLTPAEIEYLAIHHPVRTYLSGITGAPTKEEQASVRDYFLTYAVSEQFKQAYSELNALKRQKTELEKQILNTMVMDEMAKPRESYVLARGDYRNKTEKVSPAVPAVLPPLPNGVKPDRLALAKWLVDPSHPLTARVAVNRFWQLFFGTGIVKTSEDFGAQGEPPVHAELLDWLATDFIRNGWNIKALHKMIVMSATYQQTSKMTPLLREKDPENRLLARGARFRLQGELIRDNVLAVSGLMNRALGGKSVFPYQPAGLWEELAFGDGFTMQTYVPSTGADLYRRSMYTFWKRTSPPAALNTFDAPDREKCVVRRAVTNTPLQALITMNDPTYVEASRVLAQNLLQTRADHTTRIKNLFRTITLRNPNARESGILAALLKQQLTRYKADKTAAAALMKIGEAPCPNNLDVSEVAAWTMVASTILNLDETITKE